MKKIDKNDEMITIIDQRRLPMIIDVEMAFQDDLGYTETGFLFWLLALNHIGKLQEVYESKRGKDEVFDKNLNYLLDINCAEIFEGRLLVG